MASEYIVNPRKKHRVDNEINILSNLQSPHIVEYVEHFIHQKNLFIIMELCANGSLRSYMKRRTYLTLEECRYFSSGILNGVDYLHTQNVIHRDLKPHNVVLDSAMSVKICDFGLAILADDPSLKQLNHQYGTPLFCAPEVLNQKGVTFASDIWSVGVILYYLLFGNYPFNEHKKENPFDMIDPHEHVK